MADTEGSEPAVLKYEIFAHARDEWDLHQIDYRTRQGGRDRRTPAERAESHATDLRKHESEGWIRAIRVERS